MKFVPNPRKNRRKSPSPRNKSNLTLNLKELFHTRGIKHPYAVLKKLGISHTVIHAMLTGKQVFLKILHIEKICIALHCTPNELFRWAPTEATGPLEGHPMHHLNRTLTGANLVSELSELELDHLRILKKVAAELKRGNLPELEEKNE